MVIRSSKLTATSSEIGSIWVSVMFPLDVALITKLLGRIPQSMLARLDPITASMFNPDGDLLWPPPVTRETPEEKQPGGWASNDVSWTSRIRAIRAVRKAHSSLEEGVRGVFGVKK